MQPLLTNNLAKSDGSINSDHWVTYLITYILERGGNLNGGNDEKRQMEDMLNQMEAKLTTAKDRRQKSRESVMHSKSKCKKAD